MSENKELFGNILDENNSKLPTIYLAISPEGERDLDSDIDTKKQIRYGTRCQAAWGIFSEYCDNSTVHGIKYLGEQKRPILERLFWIGVFVLSIYTCTVLTINIWKKWTNNPVIVSFGEKPTPVWEIPFPAVTICKQEKFKTFNYTEILKHPDNITKDEIQSLRAISQICYIHEWVRKDMDVFGENFVNASDMILAMDKLLNITDLNYLAKFRNNVVNSIRKVVTEEGICYTFNNLQPKDIYRTEALTNVYKFGGENDDEVAFLTKIPGEKSIQWDPETGYRNTNIDAFPFRVLREGDKSGLNIHLFNIFEQGRPCWGMAPGYKVLLHTPGEVPRVTKQFISIPFNKVVWISIKPEIITTTEGLKHYDPTRRHCYFQHERQLRYFKVYTQNNCKLECLSNFTMQRCGCVRFSMPRTQDTKVCGAAKIDCMFQAEHDDAIQEFSQSMDSNLPMSCNCLPGCTSISYNAEISQGSFTPISKTINIAELSIFFKEAQFITLRRSELYGRTDFLANCGGLLGLFMGVSALSIVELIYFCTVRLLTNLRMRRRKRFELERVRSEEG